MSAYLKHQISLEEIAMSLSVTGVLATQKEKFNIDQRMLFWSPNGNMHHNESEPCMFVVRLYHVVTSCSTMLQEVINPI